jgi:murein DD-endopeptidase MepM/ murein hydrolase activator NlpD
VRDPFRLDAGPYGPGNRGLEYATVAGDVARAIGSGRVSFAGAVAGRLAVTVLHPDGRRSSLTGLAALDVRAGDVVLRGQQLGRAGPGLHLGVREGDRYIDPATLFAPLRRRAVLVPLGAVVPD